MVFYFGLIFVPENVITVLYCPICFKVSLVCFQKCLSILIPIENVLQHSLTTPPNDYNDYVIAVHMEPLPLWTIKTMTLGYQDVMWFFFHNYYSFRLFSHLVQNLKVNIMHKEKFTGILFYNIS